MDNILHQHSICENPVDLRREGYIAVRISRMLRQDPVTEFKQSFYTVSVGLLSLRDVSAGQKLGLNNLIFTETKGIGEYRRVPEIGGIDEETILKAIAKKEYEHLKSNGIDAFVILKNTIYIIPDTPSRL